MSRTHDDVALSALTRRSRLRLLSTLQVGVTGLAALVGGLAPAWFGELLEVTGSPTPGSLLTGRVVLVQAGLLLLMTARLLGRGSRGAWTVATAATAATAADELPWLGARLGLAPVG